MPSVRIAVSTYTARKESVTMRILFLMITRGIIMLMSAALLQAVYRKGERDGVQQEQKREQRISEGPFPVNGYESANPEHDEDNNPER
jgi:hypothetical protein